MSNYIYVPGLSESVEKEIKAEELKKQEQKKQEKMDKSVSTTGAKKKYVQIREKGEVKPHLVDDRDIKIPFWEKYALTVKEASEYYNIPESRLKKYAVSHKDENFILKVGVRILIKRKLFEIFLDEEGKI